MELAFTERRIHARGGQIQTILHFRGPEGREVSLALDGEVAHDFAQRCRVFSNAGTMSLSSGSQTRE